MGSHLDSPLRWTTTLGALLLATASIAVEPATTARNWIDADEVYAQSAHWPAIVKMTETWTTPDGTTLWQHHQGVLIRVHPDDHLSRIDFGRFGVHDVAFELTDIVERTNAVRSGELLKMGPNFVLLIGTKLVDTRAERPTPLPSSEVASGDAFLCVFANPEDPGFAALVAEISSLSASEGLRTIFFPQDFGREDLIPVSARLRELGWAVPLAPVKSYTRSLMPPGKDAPYALLVTPEGRIIHQTRLGNAGDAASLSPAIERATAG